MALQSIRSDHWTDDGTPMGGVSQATGILVSWQNGPCPVDETGARPNENGGFVETIILIAKDRLSYYQDGKFASEENAKAIHYLEEALKVLDSRTNRRTNEGVEGTHTV